MTMDIVERLRASDDAGPDDPDTLHSEAADEIERLRNALTAIVGGNIPRPIGQRYRNDMEPSKHDRCIHDKWMYEDCGNCIEAFATEALIPKDAS